MKPEDQKCILLVGQTPPPFHGQAIATKLLFDHQWINFNVKTLRMAYSDSHKEIGNFQIKKVSHLLWLIRKTLGSKFGYKRAYLYYPPAGPNLVPIIRDILYLCLVRWYFKGVIFHYHSGGLVDYLSDKKLLSFLAQKAYGSASMSIEISRTKSPPHEYFSAAKHEIIPNGLDIPDIAKEKRESSDMVTVLFVGSLHESKGILQIIETARLCKEQEDIREKLKFRIAGVWTCEEFKQKAHALVDRYGLQDLVHFVGEVRDEAKWQEYQSADIFFFPTHYENENFPLVLIEALGFGLSIITTDWRGIPDLVGNCSAGILCPIKKPELYFLELKKLLNDTVLRGSMRDDAVQYYQENFTENLFLNKMEKAFSRTLENN